MNNLSKTQIIFYTVDTAQAKISAIVNLIKQYFELERKILIAVPNDEAAKYVDHLLWRYSEESFLPHAVCHKVCIEAIAFTTVPQNLNQAQILVNLCPAASPIASQFEYVMELLDNTHPDKKQLSLQRQEDYKKSGHQVMERMPAK